MSELSSKTNNPIEDTIEPAKLEATALLLDTYTPPSEHEIIASGGTSVIRRINSHRGESARKEVAISGKRMQELVDYFNSLPHFDWSRGTYLISDIVAERMGLDLPSVLNEVYLGHLAHNTGQFSDEERAAILTADPHFKLYRSADRTQIIVCYTMPIQTEPDPGDMTWFRNIIVALKALHRNGLAHGDIKLANFIGGLLGDFLSMSSADNQIKGDGGITVPYLSRELAMAIADIEEKSELDFETKVNGDIYALALAMLLHLMGEAHKGAAMFKVVTLIITRIRNQSLPKDLALSQMADVINFLGADGCHAVLGLTLEQMNDDSRLRACIMEVATKISKNPNFPQLNKFNAIIIVSILVDLTHPEFLNRQLDWDIELERVIDIVHPVRES